MKRKMESKYIETKRRNKIITKIRFEVVPRS